MTVATIKKVNAAIKKHGVELIKGDGYFYFEDLECSDTCNADKINIVYRDKLNCMTLREWIEHGEDDLL